MCSRSPWSLNHKLLSASHWSKVDDKRLLKSRVQTPKESLTEPDFLSFDSRVFAGNKKKRTSPRLTIVVGHQLSKSLAQEPIGRHAEMHG